MAALSAWECGSYLYGPQKLEVHIYPIGFEHEAVKVDRIDQGLCAGSSLLPGEGKCHGGRAKSQGSLQLFVGCTLDWRRV
jgi:hypothetical protein